VVIERTSTFDETEEPAIAFYTTSHGPTPGCARFFADLARGHWGGCESRNHWVRDACMDEVRAWQPPVAVKRGQRRGRALRAGDLGLQTMLELP